MELELQKCLRAGNRPEDLKLELGIDFKVHPKYPELKQFKYSQIDSPKDHPIVKECRGTILNSQDNWNVVAFPFTRFFNLNEPCAAPIDWSTAQVQEKLDGSLIIFSCYKGAWNVATSGSPDAGGQVGDFGMTFAELFWRTVKEQNIDISLFNTICTYMFEICTPLNRVVVDHKDNKLFLLGCRHNQTFKEYSMVSDGSNTNLCFPKTYRLKSIDDCLKAAQKLNPLQNEGFVVVDATFNRIKIKSPAYVLLHHAKDTLSRKRMALIIRTGEFEEFKVALESFKELRELFEELYRKYLYLTEDCIDTYNKIKDIKVQKEFAQEACLYTYADVLFQLRQGKGTVEQILAKMSENRYLTLMEVK